MRGSTHSRFECMLSEEVSGEIKLTHCCPHTLWEGIGLCALTTIKILNSSKYPFYLLLINDKGDTSCHSICANSEKIVSATNVQCIQVSCPCLENTPTFLGCFKLSIHHPIYSAQPKHTTNPSAPCY